MRTSGISTYTLPESVADTDHTSRMDLVVSSFNDEGTALHRQWPHRHTYYEIIWLKDSYGVHHVDFKPYAFEGPVVFLLSPQQVHVLDRKKGTEGYAVKFNEQFFSSGNDANSRLYAHFLFDNLQSYPVIPLPQAVAARLETLLQLTFQEFGNKARSEDILFSYLRVILMEIIRVRRQQLNEPHLQPGQPQQQFLAFRQLLEAHYTQLHEVQDYAALLHITPRQLNLLTHKLSGRPAGVFIKERILLEAKRLLFAGELSIKEIGYRLGFDDPAYFNRFFKKNTQLTPVQFKEGLNRDT